MRTPIPFPPSSCVNPCASCHVSVLLTTPSQKRSPSCCGLSCPSTQLPIHSHEPVPCVQMLFRAIPQVSASLPILSHLFSAEWLFRYQYAPRVAFCASSLLDVPCRLKKDLAGSLMQPTQSAQCASGVGSSRNASNFCLACFNEWSTACQKLRSMVTLLQTVCNRSQVPFNSKLCFCLCSVSLQCAAQGQKHWHVVSWQSCWDNLQSAPCFPGHTTFFDTVMNSHGSHPVIQRARSALFRVHCCDRGTVRVSKQTFHLVPCQLLFAPLVFSHERLFDLFTCSLQSQARIEMQSQDRRASLLCFGNVFSEGISVSSLWLDVVLRSP